MVAVGTVDFIVGEVRSLDWEESEPIVVRGKKYRYICVLYLRGICLGVSHRVNGMRFSVIRACQYRAYIVTIMTENNSPVSGTPPTFRSQSWNLIFPL